MIDTGYSQEYIITGTIKALQPEFQDNIPRIVNPYGNGEAAEKIVEQLSTISLDGKILPKRFYDFINTCEVARERNK
ncbi:MAG: hypothetical protein QGF64_05730 [Candidatus Poseidoniia archaeon]|jgi:UDP-N-acetylglucosamine 2-epimerase|nr:hypothetical protein [Candidatus Poseidoniia archaeon]|tara:strand:- start:473 stop:703 length:231 start_codon:yes stop_codon:yes gene_type:complete